MYKAIITAIALISATPANAASVQIDLTRYRVILDAARHICKAAMDLPGAASPIVEARSAYLGLDADEKLFLVSLCAIYAQGRVDG